MTNPSSSDVTIRVFLVDDHAIVRQGLASLLLDAEDVEIVGQAGNGVEAVKAVERLQPDVVLMDVVMPDMDGAEATAKIRARWPEVRILTLSGSDVWARILATLRAGSAGYISKIAPKEQLLEAIRRVYRGQHSMPEELTIGLLESYPATSVVEPLTRREREILVMLATGLSNQQIADRASISEATTRTHVGNIFGKLGVNNRVEATLCALRDGLTTLDECLGFGEPLSRLRRSK